MRWVVRSFMFYFFWRIFNAFLLLFFMVHVVRSGSLIVPVLDTLMTVSSWLGSTGEQTEKKLKRVVSEVKEKIH